MNTELYSFLTAGGIVDPHFYILIENVELGIFTEIEWVKILGESGSLLAQFQNWWNAPAADNKTDLKRGEIIATSKPLSSKTDKLLLVDYFIEKKRKEFPFVKFDIPRVRLKELKCKEELAALLTVSKFAERHRIYNVNFHHLQQFICLNIGCKVRISDVDSKRKITGRIIKAGFIDFQFCYFLKPDSSESAETIRFGINTFLELIMDTAAKKDPIAKQQEDILRDLSQHKQPLSIKDSFPDSHNTPTAHQPYQSNKAPMSAPVNPTYPDRINQTSHPYNLNPIQFPQEATSWSQSNTNVYSSPPMQKHEAGADAVPLNEVRPDPLPSYGLAEGCSVKVNTIIF